MNHLTAYSLTMFLNPMDGYVIAAIGRTTSSIVLFVDVSRRGVAIAGCTTNPMIYPILITTIHDIYNTYYGWHGGSMATIFVDGNFPSGKKCKFHCWPSCHPMQVGPEDVYGCTHKAWPANQYGDFCPIVSCDGKIAQCEVKDEMLVSLIKKKSDAIAKLKRHSLIEERLKEVSELQEFRQLLSQAKA